MSNITDSEIVFFVILGAGAMVCIAYVIARFYIDSDVPNMFDPPDEQHRYMREVRTRTFNFLREEAMAGRHKARLNEPVAGASRVNETV